MKLFGPLSKDQEYSICIGTGRFLRAVLVPILRQLGHEVFLCQTRGDSFVTAMVESKGSFVVDTAELDGSVSTNTYEICGVSSLASLESKHMLLRSVVPQMKKCQLIGFGVTEAGLDSKGRAMNDLAELLHAFYLEDPSRCFSILNTDNVPANGTVIAQCLLDCAFTLEVVCSSTFSTWLQTHVTCHNTMVDRITAARPGNNLVPFAEPLPKKALVIEDRDNVLHSKYEWDQSKGVLFRHAAGEIENDHVLKLCIANGVHTAMVYLMALCQMSNTRECLKHPLILEYLDRLFYQDIMPGLMMHKGNIQKQEAIETYQDWIQRLCHPSFGMNCFFVAQNTSKKLSIRLLSTANAALKSASDYHMSPFLAFALAVALRFLTPFYNQIKETERGPVFRGTVDLKSVVAADEGDTAKSYEYVTGLFVHAKSGTYDFRDPDSSIPKLLMKIGIQSHVLPTDIKAIVTKAVGCLDGVDLNVKTYQEFSQTVSHFYLQMLPNSNSGSIMDVLETVVNPGSKWIESKSNIGSIVESAIKNTKIIDVHTHLFPPTHGRLMLWGIDELLTYHYLAAEYFMTVSTVTPDVFYEKPKSEQADLIWDHLFIQRSPISEACRGVITTLQQLGLTPWVQRRDLDGIRQWFLRQNEEEYVHHVFDIANLDYVIMTNIPFEAEEAQYWLDPDAHGSSFDRRYFRSALRVDQLLTGDWCAISKTLEAMALKQSLVGCKTLLIKWIEIMKPEYFMASVPHTFTYPTDEEIHAYPAESINAATLLKRVLLPLAEEYQLPIAFKFDSVRQMNPRLKTAGDGVMKSNVDILRQLCLEYPRIKFLATFLSRVNQHEVCVLANKFANLHIYGCWWYCNVPSIIDEITRMRIEMLGTGFTAQHSDARVLDQLIYKWAHSRKVITTVMTDMYEKLYDSGWTLCPEEIRRDVQRLFGGAYTEFMQKELL